MLESAKIEFDKYIEENYDINEKHIGLKHRHSYRVMNYCIKIAESLNLNKEEVAISGLIGLLHDIGRFEQWTKYKTFGDRNSIDHGDLGASILFNNNFIRKFIEDDKYDRIIENSIKYHNKYETYGINEKELLFSRIIRDADKIDIFDVQLLEFFDDDLSGLCVTEEVYNESMLRKQVEYKYVKNKLDNKIVSISCIYDLNFKYSFLKLRENNSVNELINLIISNLDDENVIKKAINIQDNANEYINDRCNYDG
jgi:HD superfamily phosphohydrolase YqeK